MNGIDNILNHLLFFTEQGHAHFDPIGAAASGGAGGGGGGAAAAAAAAAAAPTTPLTPTIGMKLLNS